MRQFSYLLMICLLAACGPGRVSVEQPWIHTPVEGSTVLAGYALIRNETAETVTLQSVNSKAFADVGLHRTVIEDGIARMVAVDAVTIPPGGSVEMHPGGLHLMLLQPESPIRQGDRTPIRFQFSNGTSLVVRFSVRNTVMH